MKDGGTTVQTNKFDGLGRRIQRVAGSDTYDFVEKGDWLAVHRGKRRECDVSRACLSPFSTSCYDYYYNDQWQLLEERKNGDADPLHQYLWQPYYIDALALRWYDADTNPGTGVADYYYLQDANFNVTAVTDTSGDVVERYAYSPYGKVTVLDANFAADADGVSDIGNTHLYTGRELDTETGLQLNRHRFYSNWLGRWAARDPIGYGGDFNLYEYVKAQVVSAVDPLGLWEDPPSRPAKCSGKNCKWNGHLTLSSWSAPLVQRASGKFLVTAKDDCGCRYTEKGSGTETGVQGLGFGNLSITFGFDDQSATCEWPVHKWDIMYANVIGLGGAAGVKVSGSIAFGFVGALKSKGLNMSQIGGVNIFVGAVWMSVHVENLERDIKQ